MQKNRKAQQHDETQRRVFPGREQVLKACEGELPSMTADQAGEQALLLARETGHVGVLQQICAMTMIAAVRDIKSRLVQARGPLQRKIRQGILEPPSVAHLG